MQVELKTNKPITGINIRDDKETNYAELICKGKKTIETRDSNSLKPYIGKRVRIIRTGAKNSKATIIGECTIGEPIIYLNETEFEKDINRHYVKKNSVFWIKSNAIKYGYPIIEPVLYKNQYYAVGLGIIARKNQPSPFDKNIQIVEPIAKKKTVEQLKLNI